MHPFSVETAAFDFETEIADIRVSLRAQSGDVEADSPRDSATNHGF